MKALVDLITQKICPKIENKNPGSDLKSEKNISTSFYLFRIIGCILKIGERASSSKHIFLQLVMQIRK